MILTMHAWNVRLSYLIESKVKSRRTQQVKTQKKIGLILNHRTNKNAENDTHET